MNEHVEVKWTPDCQGKWDYDSDLVRLSCRYWPRGGGFWILHGGIVADNDARPEIKPSASASIYFGDKQMTSAEFEGETEQDVKVQVEAWVDIQINKIAHVLGKLYDA